MTDPTEPSRSVDEATGPGPTPDTPLERVVDRLAGEGYGGQFRAVDGARVQCLTCRNTVPASEVPMDEVTRLEGVSDPADMSVVVPVVCPHCGTRGALVLAYGPDSSAEESDVLRAMPRRPTEGTRRSGTPDPTPGVGPRPPTAP